MNYCQDGLLVYSALETQLYTYAPIYGYYELQPNDVNGRPYFKMGSAGFWWDGFSSWWIGLDIQKGQSKGFAHYDKDVYCPHQLSDYDWWLLDGKNWYAAEKEFVISCKCSKSIK